MGSETSWRTSGEEGVNLEERSFENLVLFYEPELLRIHGGESITKVMTAVAARTLLKYNVTEHRGSRRTRLSQKTLNVLGLSEYDDVA